MNVVIASNNKHKISEIRALFGEKFENMYSLADLAVTHDPQETGNTFFENALIKAKEISKLAGMAAIADDSGLSVDALDGAPGVYSARFAGEPCNDKNNNLLLLKKLEGNKNRKAKFVSCIVLYYPDGRYITETGELEGEILNELRGYGGFGYDPLFYIPELGKTMAEIGSEEKNRISHRGRAFERLCKKLN